MHSQLEKSIGDSSIKVLLRLLLLSFVGAAIGCSAQKGMLKNADFLRLRNEEVKAKQEEIAAKGGPKCGLKELALAESHQSFALDEIETSDWTLVRNHLDEGEEQRTLALEKTEACNPPDMDGDGILDNVDACPEEPEDKDGWEDEEGCPDIDNDQDGLLDIDDKCPDEPEDMDGFQDDDGCPDPDNDEDGVLDDDDQCPEEAEDQDGFQDEDGCPDPDNDEDGLLDTDDKCPDKPETFNGIDDEDGCPDASSYNYIQVTDTRIELKQKVFFATGKSRILSKSFPLLNEVALALKEHKFKVEVGGHTDSRGRDAYNMDLSRRRADSVKKYLIEKGGADEKQIVSKGYGESKPIDSNRNAAGRARNRRVEFNIIDK